MLLRFTQRIATGRMETYWLKAADAACEHMKDQHPELAIAIEADAAREVLEAAAAALRKRRC